MVRLDASLLKILLARYKDEFENCNPSHTNAEELRCMAKLLWNLAVMIIPKSETHGMGAIGLMRVLVAFDSQILPVSDVISERHKVLLIDYNLIQTVSSTTPQKICIHSPLLMEVIRARSAEYEEEILRDCLIMLKRKLPTEELPYLFRGLDQQFYTPWFKALDYPELISEFKSEVFKICYYSYVYSQIKKLEQLEPTLEVRKKTGDKFSEVFGEMDDQTIQLRILELEFNCRKDRKTPEDILREFRQYRVGFEDYQKETQDPDSNLETLPDEMLAFATRDRFSEEIIEESLDFSSKLCKICINKSGVVDGDVLNFFHLTVKCVGLLNVTSDRVIELLRVIRMSILQEQSEVHISFNPNDYILSLAQTVYELFSLKPCIDQKVFIEEMLLILESEYELFRKSLNIPSERNSFPYTSPLAFSVHLINYLSKLEKFDQIVNIYQEIRTRMEEDVQRRDLDTQKLIQDVWIGFVEIQQTIFTAATSSQSLNGDLKVALLKESMIASKYLLFCCVRVKLNLKIGCDPEINFQGRTPLRNRNCCNSVQLKNLSSHIVMCHIELELFCELSQFLKEYEEHFGQYEYNTRIIAKEMIKLGFIVLQNIECETMLKNVHLLQMISKTAIKYSYIRSDDKGGVAKIKEKAQKLIKLCEIFEK